MKPPEEQPRGEFLGAPQGSTGTLEGDIGAAVAAEDARRARSRYHEPTPKKRKREHKLSRKERRKRARQRARS